MTLGQRFMKFVFKRDEQRNVRGGYSRFANIYCQKCRTHLCLYQKDGPGPLKRIYLDRIFAPEKLTGLEEKAVKAISDLICAGCERVIAIPGIYKEENRKAYMLFSYSFIKKISKGEYPPKIAKLKQ